MPPDLREYGIALPQYAKAAPRRTGAASGKKHATPERDVARSIIKWLRLVLPDGIHASIVNEQGAASADPQARMRYGAARKASGVVTGMWDATSILPNGLTFWWEFKAPKGRVSPVQAELHTQTLSLGHYGAVVRSIEEAQAALSRAGINTIGART